MDFVLPRLAIGGYEEARRLPPEADALLCVAEERDLRPMGRPYHKIPMRDMQPIPVEQMVEALLWLRGQAERRRVLVFCNAGVGRSVSVVVAYLCCFGRFRFGDAVEFVAEHKPYMSVLPLLRPTIIETRGQLQRLRLPCSPSATDPCADRTNRPGRRDD